jgi:DNA-directed RNA polymerase specialized sigma24 family protein
VWDPLSPLCEAELRGAQRRAVARGRRLARVRAVLPRYAQDVLGHFARRVRDAEAAADLTAETFAAAVVAREHGQRWRPREAG